MNLTAGKKLSRYEIRSKLGAGGMGEVYLAEDTSLHRKIALKVLPEELASNRDRMRRFVQEAQAAAALNHPNIATIHEIGEHEGTHFIAMEFIDGVTLRGKIHQEQGELRKLLRYLQQAAEGLAKAHAAGIVHRDLKPDNIMITRDGHAKILDFGLAKLIERDQASIDAEAPTRPAINTEPGIVLGTVTYMSPEQARGIGLDARTDIFSFGVIMYEAIAGRLPFEGSSANEVMAAVLSDKLPPPLARYAIDVPGELERIVSKSLRKNPDERYQTIKDLLIDLKSLRENLEFQNKLESFPHPSVKDTESGSGDINAHVSSPTVAERRPMRLLTRYRTVGAVVGSLLLVGLAYVYFSRIPGRAISSVAVLPFVNVNGDGEAEFLADGITDNIIERLSQLPNFKVMSHTAVFTYKGRQMDPRTVGSELGVEAVLTGRFVRRADEVTINVELVNAKDDSHIWGEQYDRKISELMVLQREIPLDVSDKLKLRLSGDSKERLTRAHTDNPDAYQVYLKGRYAWEKWSLEGAKQAVAFFEEAIRKDPNYALAYAGLADVYLFGRFAGIGLPQKEAHRRGREAATKALAIDSQLAEAHAALSQVLLYDDWDFVGAERELKRALELKPNYAEGHHQYSHLLLLQGRYDESLIESQKFLDVDPVSEAPIGHLCYHYAFSRRYDEAITQCQKDIALFPDTPQGYTLGEVYFHKGMVHEAFEEYKRALTQDGTGADIITQYQQAFTRSGITGFYEYWLKRELSRPQEQQDPFFIATLFALTNDKGRAFEWLEQAYSQHSDGLVRLREELDFDSLRSDPRYFDLLRRIGLPQ